METIYSYNNEYETNNVIDKIGQLQEELEIEYEKPISERDEKKEFDLIYRQLVASLPLSTGYIKLY